MTGKGYAAQKVATMYFIDITQYTLPVPETQRLPAFSFVLTFFRLFWNDARVLLVIGFTSYALLLFHSYRFIESLVSVSAARLSLLILSIFPTLQFYSAILPSVDVFTAAMTVGFFDGLSILSRQKKPLRSWLALTSVYGILAVMSRQNTILLILPTSLAFLPLHEWWKKRPATLPHITIPFIALFVALTLWVGRNWWLVGRPTLSTASGMQLFMEMVYFTPFPTEESAGLQKWLLTDGTGLKFMAERLQSNVAPPVAYGQLDTLVSERAWGYIIRNPHNVFRHFTEATNAFIQRPSFSWVKEDFFSSLLPLRKLSIFLSLTALLYPLTVFTQRKLEWHLLPLWLGVVAFIFISAFFHGITISERGVVPVLPFLLLLSWVVVESVVRRLRKTWRNE